MQLNFFLYVKRNWQEDQLSLTQFVDYYKRLNCDYRIILFPEGTDLSDENKLRSEKYAIANNLPVSILISIKKKSGIFMYTTFISTSSCFTSR